MAKFIFKMLLRREISHVLLNLIIILFYNIFSNNEFSKLFVRQDYINDFLNNSMNSAIIAWLLGAFVTNTFCPR